MNFKLNVLFIITGIYFYDPEITPSGQGVCRFNKNGAPVESFPPEVEVRAVIESQFLAKLNHARKLGYEISPTSRVLATGGASANTRILQVSLRCRKIWKNCVMCSYVQVQLGLYDQ